MDLGNTTHLIIEYRYWILVPLAIAEGPIVAFAAGTLASLGYFNIYVLAIFFLARDLIMDGIYYAIGYWGGQTALVHRMMKRLGITQDHLNDVEHLWANHAGKTMFIGKLSYGIASTFVVLAGTVNMPLKKFFGWGAIVTIIQFWGLLALGYWFGASIGNTANIVQDTSYIIGVVGLLIAAYYIFTHFMRGKFMKETEEAEKGD